ncbi:hypothetical protein LZ30DRAFT_139616 [Colletotrichum cereale]|nr:hypothetical protein LZ30DRAFT_139616 [Colletotrichum cereale]
MRFPLQRQPMQPLLFGGKDLTHVLPANLCAAFFQAVLYVLALVALMVPQASDEVVEGFLEPGDAPSAGCPSSWPSSRRLCRYVSKHLHLDTCSSPTRGGVGSLDRAVVELSSIVGEGEGRERMSVELGQVHEGVRALWHILDQGFFRAGFVAGAVGSISRKVGFLIGVRERPRDVDVGVGGGGNTGDGTVMRACCGLSTRLVERAWCLLAAAGYSNPTKTQRMMCCTHG